MLRSLKKVLYFPFAWYFRLFAQIKLARWKPRIIVLTGSSGKTTLLHLVEAQIGARARYSHHANSAYGIPFDILGIKRITLEPSEWLGIIFKTPLRAFTKIPSQKIYIVEADCDRPGEGSFLASLLKPEVTIWVSASRTHSMNFDPLVEKKAFAKVEEAIAYEYGFFLEHTSKLSIIDSDSQLIKRQTERTTSEILEINKKKNLDKYEVKDNNTFFSIDGKRYEFKFLLPEAVYFSVTATKKLMEFLELKFDSTFENFTVPPGRNSVFKGIKNTTLIDSSYNTGFAAYEQILELLRSVEANKKWAVIGDILEQGKEEKEEHEKLAHLIAESDFDRIILLGPRIQKYGLAILEKKYGDRVVSFLSPKEVLDFLNSNIQGGETILFKGARFLEGVIEHLLLNKEDISKLSRREKIWEKRREKWGL